MSGETRVTTRPDETQQAGVELAARLRPGDLVILSGPLGAGKTVFVKGLALGMGIDPKDVHSPSYTMVSEYGPAPSGVRLVHADLYRVDEAAEIDELGLADYLTGDHVVAVEWGERLPAVLKRDAIVVSIEDAGEERRRLSVSHAGSSGLPA